MGDKREKRLVRLARRGDREAVTQLMIRYEKEIFGYIYRMTRNAEDAKDLTQDVFIKVFKNIAGFKGNSSFRTWLYRIATHHTLNFLTRRPPSGSEQALGSLPDPSPSSRDVLESKEVSRHLTRAVTRLPNRQRSILILRAYEGLTYTEIAGVLGCSVGNCKAAYHNAIVNLREILKDEAIL